jgi:hypothetical protein
MSLAIILSQLLNRSALNPGSVHKIELERGLEVAFRTNTCGIVTMQLSRLKPSEPSDQELIT